ncbi:homeodomain-interacting protein kinase 2-like [Xyrichtys novacula]|uniref:Homeodomain-interacting protein kinase 2-like n=1 Tax=Xyrichtys novacula TaxID=13765 RepID=A0AAV1FUP9_XYRNO|nr:homeodomain-interacting protein kinase 2-like [Xyrichtys novacula]
MLDRNLIQLLNDRKGRPLSLNEIRPIAQQLFTASHALKGIGVIHADLKPDNVMLVNHETQPFRVKLIDFGLLLQTIEKDWSDHTGSQKPMVIRQDCTTPVRKSIAIPVYTLN